jgi:hypothetical protein
MKSGIVQGNVTILVACSPDPKIGHQAHVWVSDTEEKKDK